MKIAWSSSVEVADWWARRLHGFAEDVGSFVPDTFVAVARVFHPAVIGGAVWRWSDLAVANDRVPHAEMQFHAITNHAQGGPWGSLHGGDCAALAELLTQWTTTPERCWCAFWEGSGGLSNRTAFASTPAGWLPHKLPALVPDEVLNGPRIHVPERDYLLAEMSLTDLVDLTETLGQETPNVWWPDDRAWIAACEVDFDWTYVAGPAALIARIVDEPRLEALQTDFCRHHRIDSDHINSTAD